MQPVAHNKGRGRKATGHKPQQAEKPHRGVSLRAHSKQGRNKVTGRKAIDLKAEAGRGQDHKVAVKGRDHKAEAVSNLKILTSRKNKINQGQTNRNKTNQGRKGVPISLLMQQVSGRHSSKGHRGHQGHSARTGQGRSREVHQQAMRRRLKGSDIHII